MKKLEDLKNFEILNKEELDVLNGGFGASSVDSVSNDKETNKRDAPTQPDPIWNGYDINS